jgi:small-conductance mechanosensitive channel
MRRRMVLAQERSIDPSSLELTDLILAAVVVVVAGVVAGWLRRRIRKQLGQYEGLDENMPRLLGQVAGWTVMLVGILFALGVLGYDIGFAVLAVLFVAGMLALAGKGVLENFAAGMLLQIRAPFHVGDRIEAGGFSGTVERIDGHAVVIETDDHRTVHVPNRQVVDDPIVSYTNMPIRRSEVDVGVAYDTDISAVQALLAEATARVDGVLPEKTPQAFIHEFADSSIGITIHFWHDDGRRIEVRARVAEAIKETLDAAGIEIPFPQRVVTMEAAQ